MTHASLYSEDIVCERNHSSVQPITSHTTIKQDIQPKGLPLLGEAGKAEKIRRLRSQLKRRRVFEASLRRLSQMDIFGKSYVEEFLRDQYRRHCSPNTIRNSMTAIENFLFFIKASGKTYLEAISREDLSAWIENGQDRGLSINTVKIRLRTLNVFLRFLIERDVVMPEVLSKRMIIKVPESLPRAMDSDDVRRLLSVIDHVRNRAMILVLLRSGMRIGELLNTLVDDINLKERRIDIYEAEKTLAGRVVYLSKDAIGALRKWFKERDHRKPFLFYAQGRDTMTYPSARMMFKKYVEKAGLSHKGYTLHCLRHTFATDVLNAGMRLDCVQALLGHSSIEMTRRYAKLTDKTREEEYFRAMAIIEKGEKNGHYQLDRELQAFLKEEKLLSSYDQELHEHP
jgi:integrase/recombinase XerD